MITKNKFNVYAQDGVNIASGDSLSSIAKNFSMRTYDNSKFVKVSTGGSNYFRAPVTVEFKLPEGCTYFTLGSDGIGTKVGIHQSAGTYNLAPFDLTAMVTDDAVRHGMLPLILCNILDVDRTGSNIKVAGSAERRNFQAIKMLYHGLMNAAMKAGIVLIGGETAELGKYVGSEIPESMALHFNMGAVVQSVSHPDKLITDENLRPGQVIIALKENGFRSNGISSVRKALAFKFGADWWNNPEARESIVQAATPSIIYSKFVSTLNGWYAKDFKPEVKLHAVSHITGGGIEGKFAKDFLFRNELSASLNNLFDPPKIMADCRTWRKMDESEAYTTWNGGQGMILVVDNEPQIINHVITRAKSFDIEAQVCGDIRKWKNARLSIESKFGQKKSRLIYKAG